MSYLEMAKKAEERILERAEGALRAVSGATTLYQAALRAWWAFAAQGAEAKATLVRYVYQEILRLIDEVGEPAATTLRRAWARQWREETGRCPTCGEPGVYHDPEGSP
jgi:hypothetical protein